MATGGGVLGLLAGQADTQLVTSMLYGLKRNDPVTIAMAVSVLAGVAPLAGATRCQAALGFFAQPSISHRFCWRPDRRPGRIRDKVIGPGQSNEEVS